MLLEELKGGYDLALSIGAACPPAWHLRRHGLRAFSGPFDWVVIVSVPHTIKAIESKFSNYFARENLVVQKRHEHHYLVMDELNQCLSVHDFPLVEGDDPERIFDSYPEVIKKMQRRIDRFYERIARSKRTLFVRFHATCEEARALSQCLDALTSGKFSLIVVNETPSETMIEEGWDIKNTYAAQLYQTPDMRWQGHDPHWDHILSGIYLNDSPPAGLQHGSGIADDPF